MCSSSCSTRPRRRCWPSSSSSWPWWWVMAIALALLISTTSAEPAPDNKEEMEAWTMLPTPRLCPPEAHKDYPFCAIAIVHYRKPQTPWESFEVGFRAAVALLEARTPLRFTWVNLYDLESVETSAESICEYLSNFDHYWAKSNWDWIVDSVARTALSHCPLTRSLLISGTHPPPSEEALHFYQVLFYETHWYHGFASLNRHPLALHAFGIDTSIMSRQAQGIPDDLEPEWDYLVVSNVLYNNDDKRTLKLLEKKGRRILVGASSGEKARAIVQQLQDDGVHIRNMVSYQELARIIPTARTMYIPDNVFGGGERAVLEARAMGVNVEVEEDSPKLKELVRSSFIYDHHYYASQLFKGMLRLAQSRELERGGGGGASATT